MLRLYFAFTLFVKIQKNILGKQAILTIFDDGKKVEDIQLYSLKEKSEMHELFVSKGFHKKDTSQIQEERRVKQVEKELKQQDAAKPVMSVIFQLYAAIGIVTLVFAFLINSRRGKNNKSRNNINSNKPRGTLAQV